MRSDRSAKLVMSAQRRDVPEPGELVYAPRPSWLPAFFAFFIALALCGVYAEGFMVRGWIYSIIGLIAALLVLRALIAGSVGDFFRLRRRQRARGAVLPVEPLRFPPKD
jgi:hypothetical protein